MKRYSWMTRFAAVCWLLSGCEVYFVAPTVWSYIKSLGQTKLFLAFVVSAFNVGAVIAGSVAGFLIDRLGNPRFIFLSSCVTKVFAYIIYSVNLSAYFPLLGMLVSGLGELGTATILGQIALQPDKESRAKNFVFMDGAFCLGAAFGPAIGSLLTFQENILGWQINEGNSPGIVLAIIWLLFFVLSILFPKEIWIAPGACNVELARDDEASDPNGKQRLSEHIPETTSCNVLKDMRIISLLFLIFSSEAFSSTSTFYVPVLALDHFHLQLIHIKLLFLNCTLFTTLLLICLYFGSQYIEERKLFLIALLMQIIAISFLTYLAFSWDQVTHVQWYLLLLYICFGMPYFAFPLGSSILSKITDPGNATFVQGLSYASLNAAIVISRVLVSFASTKTIFLWYCFGMVILWAAGAICYAMLYKRIAPKF